MQTEKLFRKKRKKVSINLFSMEKLKNSIFKIPIISNFNHQ